MKVLIALVAVLGLVAFSQALSDEERKAIETQLISECKGKESGTDDDVQSFLKREQPTTKTGKCMGACIGETLGLIKDNKNSVEGNIEIAKMLHPGNDKALELAKTIATECSSVADADRCELAAKLMKCSEQVAIANGWDPKKMM